MTGKELIVCIALVVIICFIIAALLGAMRAAEQSEKGLQINGQLNEDLKKFILEESLKRQKEINRQLVADVRKLREENHKLYKECIVLRQGQQEKEANDGKKERSEKV